METGKKSAGLSKFGGSDYGRKFVNRKILSGLAAKEELHTKNHFRPPKQFDCRDRSNLLYLSSRVDSTFKVAH